MMKTRVGLLQILQSPSAMALIIVMIPWAVPAMAQASDVREDSKLTLEDKYRPEGGERPLNSQILSGPENGNGVTDAGGIGESTKALMEEIAELRKKIADDPAPTYSIPTVLLLIVTVATLISSLALLMRVRSLLPGSTAREGTRLSQEGLSDRSPGLQLGEHDACKSMAELSHDDCFLLAAKLLRCEGPPTRLDITFGSGRVASIIINTDVTESTTFMDELHEAIDLVKRIRSELWHLRKLMRDPTNTLPFDHKKKETMKALDEANEDLRKRLIYIAREIHIFDQSRANLRDPPTQTNAA